MEKRVGIGKQNHFKSAPYVVTWIDLLGYGSMLKRCRFDPTSIEASNAVSRLEAFNEVTLKHSHLLFPIMQMNDGVASWRELSFRTKSVTQDFLARSLDLFYDITNVEKKMGFPGPRMVIATGIRMKMNDMHKEVARQRANYLISKLNDGEITVDEAIYTACNFRDFCNGVNALQANFAFTKAFLAEESGKKGGLPGNNAFIDMNIFEKTSLTCLDIENPFDWSEHQGLETKFAKVKLYSRETFMKNSIEEISSTLDISKRILDCKRQEEVLRRLKE